jgi:hypothetical protein
MEEQGVEGLESSGDEVPHDTRKEGRHHREFLFIIYMKYVHFKMILVHFDFVVQSAG